MTKVLAILGVTLALALPAAADEVSDALQAALTAWQSGDIGTAGAQVTIAQQAIQGQQSARMAALLPPAPEGFTRTDTEDFAQGFAIAGGGSGAEANYANADGSVSFKMSLVADNPVVAAMGAMLGSEQMMAMMGKVEKVGDQALLSQDGSLSALVANRVLFQASGAATDQMLPVVQKIDFAKVASFDKP